MRHLMADLIDKLVAHEDSSQKTRVQLGAVQIIVMALYARLDEQSRYAIHENITQSFEKISYEALSAPDDLELLRSAIFALLNQPVTLPLSHPAG